MKLPLECRVLFKNNLLKCLLLKTKVKDLMHFLYWIITMKGTANLSTIARTAEIKRVGFKVTLIWPIKLLIKAVKTNLGQALEEKILLCMAKEEAIMRALTFSLWIIASSHYRISKSHMMILIILLKITFTHHRTQGLDFLKKN